MINAYDITTGAFLGTMTDASGNPVMIDGLRGLSFGNDVLAGLHNTLYYTAGTNGGADGTMGSLSLSSYAVAADAKLTADGSAIKAVEGQTFSGVVATFDDEDPGAVPGDFVVAIDWGDGQESPPDSVTFEGSPEGVVFTVTGSHAYAGPGSYQARVTIVDEHGDSTAIADDDVDIEDGKLNANGYTFPPIVEGSGLTSPIVATFEDQNPNATPADFVVGPAPAAAVIEWGDETAGIGVVVPAGHAADGEPPSSTSSSRGPISTRRMGRT